MNSSPATTMPPAAAQRFAAASADASTSTPTPTPVASPWPSTALLKGQKSVTIEHLGQIYRLQVTKLGKLILTK